MSKFKMTALVSTLCLTGVVFYSLLVSSQTPQATVRLITNPPISKIIPFEAEATAPQSPVQLILQAVDAVGQPLENAKIQLQILTPPKNLLFPTDFPIVEGTELLNVEALAPKGKLQIQQMLPIRGKYQLLVNVTPIVANAFTPIQQTLTLSVPENWVKYRNFGILAVILLMLGIGGGWVMGGQQIQVREIAPQRVRLLLSGAIIVAIASLLIINISAEVAESHTHDQHSPTQEPVVQTAQGVEARILGDIQATVGQPAKLAVQLLNTITNQPAKDVILNIKTTQSEHNWVAFAYQGTTDANGRLAWKQQFFDGAPHKVEVEVLSKQATSQVLPLRIAKTIEIEGIAPPLSVRLIALTYFTSIIVLGLLLGLRLKNKDLRLSSFSKR